MQKKDFIDNSIYTKIIRYIYWFLMLNVLVVVTNIPVIFALSFYLQTNRIWLLLLSTSVLLGPTIGTLFQCYTKILVEKDLSAIQDYVSFFLISFKRGSIFSTLWSVSYLVCFVDLFFIFQHPSFVYLLPVVVLLFLFCTALLLNGLYFYSKNPTSAWRDNLRISVYYIFRKWPVSLLNLSLVGLLCIAFVFQQALGLFVLPSLVFYLVYLNAAHLHQEETA